MRHPAPSSIPEGGAVLSSRYDGAMASFTLDGITYEYLRPDPGHDPEAAHSWTYGQYPKVMATLPLSDGTVDVYAVAERWNPSFILVSWQDDEWHAHWAWIPRRKRPPRQRLRMGHRRIPPLPGKTPRRPLGEPAPRLPAGLLPGRDPQSSLLRGKVG